MCLEAGACDDPPLRVCHHLGRRFSARMRCAGSRTTHDRLRHSGKEAADRLVEYLKKGYSTVILPDGPSGPPFKMKKGVFHISLRSGVPIVPMRFESANSIEIQYWDLRKWPLPFSKFTVIYGAPIQITDDNFDTAYGLISKAL